MTSPPHERPRRQDVAAAAVLLAPFALAVAALALARPPGPFERAHSDPLMQLIAPLGGPFLVAALGVVAALVWAAVARPDRAALRAAMLRGLAGAAVAVGIAGAIRLVAGPSLPAFIPPEEGAKPGIALGLAAGVLEEVVFRLALLPLGYAVARRRLGRRASLVVAILVTGLAFSLSHELGPGGGAWDLGHLATRFLFPGVLMSVVFVRIGPAFIVCAHAAGHVVMPAFFA